MYYIAYFLYFLFSSLFIFNTVVYLLFSYRGKINSLFYFLGILACGFIDCLVLWHADIYRDLVDLDLALYIISLYNIVDLA